MSTTTDEPARRARTFAYPPSAWGHAALLLAFLLAIAVVVVAGAFRPGTEPPRYLWLLGGIVALLAFKGLCQLPSLGRIRVDDHGIADERRGRDRVALAWEDVAELREHPDLGRLVLTGRDGHTKIRIGYAIRDFLKLYCLIGCQVHEEVAFQSARELGQPPVRFRRSFGYYAELLIFLGICAGAVAMSLNPGPRAPASLALAGAIAVLILALCNWHAVDVDRHRFTLRHLGREHPIEASAIEEVRPGMTSSRGLYGRPFAYVKLRDNDRWLVLGGVRPSTLTLIGMLHTIQQMAAEPPRLTEP